MHSQKEVNMTEHAAMLSVMQGAVDTMRNALAELQVRSKRIQSLESERNALVADLAVSEKSREEYIEETIRLREANGLLVAESDEAREQAQVWRDHFNTVNAQRETAEAGWKGQTEALAHADAELIFLRAEVARLREALEAIAEAPYTTNTGDIARSALAETG